jgi:hypothetical protein
LVVPERTIEDQQVKTAEVSPSIPSQVASRTAFGRAPSAKGSLRPITERRPSALAPMSPAMEAETWRSKVVQVPPQPTPQQPPPPVPLPLLEQVDSFFVNVDENVEVVDFSEHGKLIGVTPPEVPPGQRADIEIGPPQKPPRPQAADFFQDDEMTQDVSSSSISKVDEGSWRRKVSPTREVSLLTQIPEKPKLQISPTLYHAAPASPYRKNAPVNVDDVGRPKEYSQAQPSSSHPPPIKSPLTSSYREAPMSALTDTMARIKGALDGMHQPPPNHKWLPPALRSRLTRTETVHDHIEHIDREIFDVTGYEPPTSPKPAWNHFTVRLPRSSRKREGVPAKRLRAFVAPTYDRLDVLSVAAQGGKRVFLLNDILFPRPTFIKGRLEYRVFLPNPLRSRVLQNGPIVNLPAPARFTRSADTGAFGRPKEADGVATWRKPAGSLPPREGLNETLNGLDTVSCSPPPDPPRTPSEPSSAVPSSPKVSVPPVKFSKAQPKVPDGSGVAFYRDARIESADSATNSVVRFIVSSELDEEVQSNQGDKLLMWTSPLTTTEVVRRSPEPNMSVSSSIPEKAC